MKQLTKKEALREASEWLNKLSLKNKLFYKEHYYPFDLLTVYKKEHPDIQIVEPLSLFEKAENLWQNLNAAIILLEVGGKPNMKILKECIELNKPSKDDK